jgi:rod shape-determining protein MreC
MPRNEAARRRLVFAVLVVVSLALLTAFFREPASGFLHSMQRGGLGVLSPVQSFTARALEPFGDGYRWTKDLWAANSENREMARELEELRGNLIALKEAQEENERLKQLLDFQQAGIFPDGSTFVVARVVGKSPTKWRAWVQIDRGRADGIRVNQPVVGATVPADRSLSGKGLVGKVIKVAEHAAQIQLITDPESHVAAVVQGTRAEGILVAPKVGQLFMDFVERDQEVEVKRVVVTSGHSQLFPKGIPIGVVDSVGEVDVDVYKQIEVRPFVDFRSVEEVMVLTNPQVLAVDPDEMEGVVPLDTPSTTTPVGG